MYIACLNYHKSYLDDCEFKKFFPYDNEIDYSNFFKAVKSVSSLRTLSNETVDGKVKTDAEYGRVKNSGLDPLLNFSTQCFLTDSAVGNIGLSMVGVDGVVDINHNHDLTSSGFVGMGSNTTRNV